MLISYAEAFRNLIRFTDLYMQCVLEQKLAKVSLAEQSHGERREASAAGPDPGVAHGKTVSALETPPDSSGNRFYDLD